jgi:hypothetical protein
MNIKKLKKAIEELKTNLGPGLLATDIFDSAEKQSIAGWNSNPQACALFGTITESMNNALSASAFPTLDKYYLLNLVSSKLVMVIPLGDYQWGMLLDKEQASLGLILNIALPNAISAFEDALIG